MKLLKRIIVVYIALLVLSFIVENTLLVHMNLN